MRVVCISDTHELHNELTVPPGDLLIHAGDFGFFAYATQAVEDFDGWLGRLPHRWKVLTGGNHEFWLANDPKLRKLITNATLLLNESVTVGPAKIWASPITLHPDAAFRCSDPAERTRIYSQIPSDTDIVVTHGPPYDILDRGPGDAQPSGDRELREAIIRVKPLLHVYGHAHAGYGVRQTKHTTFINASLFGPDGSLSNRPIVLEISRFKEHPATAIKP